MAEHYRNDARRWTPTQWDGVQVCFVGEFQRSCAALFRLRAGATIAVHAHPRGEHTYIVEGEGMFGDLHVRAGDAVYTHPSEVHDVRALTELTFLGVAPR